MDEGPQMPDRNQPALDFLLTRRSYPAKMMTGPGPDEAALTEILTAALRVPDHGKLEPWRLVVLEDAALNRIAAEIEARGPAAGVDPDKIAKSAGTYRGSPLAVMVVSAPVPSDKIPEIEQVQSAAALCLGLVNAATAAGWGANWLSGWFSHDRTFATEVLGIGTGETVAGLIHIGTPGPAAPDRPRPDLSKVVSRVSE